MKERKKIKVASRQDMHSVIEYAMDAAVFKNKTGKMTFSIPYYDLVEKPEDFDPIYLNIEITTSWDTEKLDTVFVQEQEKEQEESDEKQKRTPSKNKKH